MAKFEIDIDVFRNNNFSDPIRTSSSFLTPGDIIEIPEGKVLPCDVILMNGLCIMNEAMLTGESILVVKSALPKSSAYYNSKEDKQYTLFAGTMCVQSRGNENLKCLGLVTNTGYMTLKGGLIRSILFPRKSEFRFYTDALKFVVIMVAVSILGIFSHWQHTLTHD